MLVVTRLLFADHRNGPVLLSVITACAKSCLRQIWAAGCMVALVTTAAIADPLVDADTRIDQAKAKYGLTGRNVLVAIMDRGLDYTHPDFINADGTTRVEAIFDLTDDTGATAPGNTYGMGTLYTKAQIQAALAGPKLATRDAVGHGTSTAGLCCGNGRASNGKYKGPAENSRLLIIKITSDGAPAHDGQPAEAPFYDGFRIPVAVNWAVAKAYELGLPMVMVLNLGSPGGPTDGTSVFSVKIDATVGAAKPGLVFLTGTGDDGGQPNHATGSIGAGQVADLKIHKASASGAALTVDFWYDERDRFDVSVVTPVTTYGPYASPPANSDYSHVTNAEFQYYHQGSGSHFSDATYNAKRRIFFRMLGSPGEYTLHLSGASVTVGTFEASLNPSEYWNSASAGNVYTTFATQSKTLWDLATAHNNIAPNSYVLRNSWTDIDGIPRTFAGEGLPGELWKGSSIGPTYDGRIGVDFSAPGDRAISTYSPTSYWATFRFNLVQDGAGLYGIAGAVSAANPLSVGIIALLLEKQPTLDAAQIKSLLRSSARSDANTSAVPNPRFGYGKIDALAALDALGVSGASNYQGLWWAAPAGSESGWGINFAHQGDTIFASWFTYDLMGKGLWLVMTATKTGNGIYAGTLFQLTGPAFDAVPFPPLGSPGGAVGSPVGTGTLTFTDTNDGSFAYTVNGIAQTKTITREAFGTLPTCTYSAQPNLALATNYQDLWWAVPGGSESGWGVNLTHQGDTIFASWFTYDHDRTPMWLVVSAPKTAPGTYMGTLYRLTGPPFNAVPFPPLGSPGGAIGTSVGTATFTFSDGNTGTFAYTVNAETQTKNITRELFQPPAGTVCQ
jgi:minor extracellular serine protease Vpr